MPNQINRDIYVLSNKIKNPVDYVQGTDALDIIFKFRDFEIPDAAEAQVFVSKPSGKAVYNTAAITGNTVTVNTTPEMFSEIGNTELQINIRNNSELLTSFIQPVMVQKNLSFHGESGNESDFFEEYIGKIDTAVSEANSAAEAADKAASNADETANEIQHKAENGEFSASISIGTVSTGEPESDAEVTNSGTEKDAVLNFVIPQGKEGQPGQKGDPGSIENIDLATIDFAQSASRTNIESGDTFATIFGKISKWFADLGTAAFRGVSNALTTSEAGKHVLDAYQGKVLSDMIGDPAGLTTEDKGSAVDAINEINMGLSGLNTAYYNDSKTQSIPDRTMTQVYNVQLQPGTYLITCDARGGLNDADAGFIMSLAVPGFAVVNSRGTLLNGGGLCISKIYELSTVAAIAVSISHTHGSSVDVTAGLSYIKLR